MSTMVKGNHPLAEIVACKLFGINSVPDKERTAMVSRCAKAAVNYVEQLERDLNEAKAQIAMTDTAYRMSLKQLSALKQHIKDGDLIHTEVFIDWLNSGMRTVVPEQKEILRRALKQFAAERAKATSVEEPAASHGPHRTRQDS